MITNIPSKPCLYCEEVFYRDPGLTNANWKMQKFCCRPHQIKYNAARRTAERLANPPSRKDNWKGKAKQDGEGTVNLKPFILRHWT